MAQIKIYFYKKFQVCLLTGTGGCRRPKKRKESFASVPAHLSAMHLKGKTCQVTKTIIILRLRNKPHQLECGMQSPEVMAFSWKVPEEVAAGTLNNIWLLKVCRNSASSYLPAVNFIECTLLLTPYIMDLENIHEKLKCPFLIFMWLCIPVCVCMCVCLRESDLMILFIRRCH